MELTQGAAGMLLKKYRAVLRKCRMLNWLGCVVVAGALFVGWFPNVAEATDRAVITAAGDNREFGNTDSFEGYVNPQSGGGIRIQGASVVTVNGSSFSKNVVLTANNLNSGGGAISVQKGSNGGLIINSGSFSENQSNVGGAINLAGGNPATINNASFSGNKALIGESKQNSAGRGGAILYSSETNGSPLNLSNSEFTSNSSEREGGALFIQGHANLTNNIFKENTASDAYSGGAISIASGVTSDVQIENNTFENNLAGSGGAINSDGQKLSINGGTFSGNKATEDASAQHPAGGGAIKIGSESDVAIYGATFKNNSANYDGGAISTRHNVDGTNDNAKLVIGPGTDGTPTVFSGNTAANNGGAIYNSFVQDRDGNPNVTVSAVFENNEAANGGAIYNDGADGKSETAGIMKITDSTFTGNKSSGDGGAVYNTDGEMTFSGTNEFNNNTAAGTPNDVYNTNKVVIESGKTSFNSGYVQAASPNNPAPSLTVAGGATLAAKKIQLDAGTATFESDSTFAIQAQDAAPATGGVITGAGTVEVEDGAKLQISGAQPGQEYLVINTDVKPDSDWDPENISTDNPLVTLKRNANGDYVGDAVPAQTIFTRLDPELVAVLNDATVSLAIGTSQEQLTSGPRGTQFLSRALVKAFDGNVGGAETDIESASRMVVVGAVPQMTKAANDAAANAVTQRTGMANPKGQLQEQRLEGSSFALWIMPLFQSVNGFSMEAGNFDYDFSGALGGVTLGADYTFENALRAGILFNIGGGYARGSGDLNATKNNMNFWGIGAYAGWSQNNFGITADVDYTSTYNELKQDISGMGDINELKADVNAWVLSAGLRAEYKLVTNALDIIPHVGVRFYNINVDSYDITSHGTVIDGDSMTQNIWTFPVGVSLTKEVEFENGWSFKPLLDLNVIPAAGDIKAKSKIRFTGTKREAELDTKMMDYITYGGTLGMEFGKENFSLGVNYNAQFGAESSAHGLFGTFRYEF